MTAPDHRAPAQASWGGRFSASPSELMQAINVSLGFDRALWRQDIAGSRAHAAMLAHVGVIPPEDEAAIARGLDTIEQELAEGRFVFDPAAEDIHMAIEQRLAALVGEPGRRLHTARSRNDQVATDLRLWVRDAIAGIDGHLTELMRALVARAGEHAADPMPGFTHLQAAQPVTLGHHLLAYVEMFARDRGRFADAARRLAECPLGAAALAGTGFPIDRAMTARALGFDRPCANSIDAVSDRDFAVEFLAAAALCATHVSRLAEELVLWCSPGFDFVSLPDALSTGSSIMPQKRNPDAAELARAKTGRILGALVSLLTVLKALPLAYGKDLQEDKEPVFDATASLTLCLQASTAMIRAARFHLPRLRAMAETGHSTATDLADWLVRELNLPFRDAHHVTGRLVARADELGLPLACLPLDVLQAEEPRLTEAVRAVLTVDASIASRRSLGGTAPDRVREQVARWQEALA